MDQTVAQQAMALAQSGRPLVGLKLLRNAQIQSNPAAYLLEGLWLLEGRFLPRDALAARERLGQAAELGHLGAARTLAGLVAAGIGAAPDWPEAVALLQRWATRDPLSARQLELIGRMNLGESGQPPSEFCVKQVSADPRIERIDGLLTPDECRLLIDLAEPRMRRATIFHEAVQRFVEDPIRRSDKAAFPIVSEWPFVRAINLRIAYASNTNVECGEPLQVLRYGPEQEYRAHVDAIEGMANPRLFTALVWLNDDYSGGETRFDQLGLTERGRTGDLIVFSNTLADGSPDPRIRHAGALVTNGFKYIASRWIRARPPQEDGFGRHEVERGYLSK